MRVLRLLAITSLIIGLLMATNEDGTEVLQKLNSSISSDVYDEIAPCVSKDGKTLYFTRLAYPKFDKTLIESGTDLSTTLKSEAYFSRLASIYSTLSGGHQINNPVESAFNQDIWIAHAAGSDFDLIEHPGYPLNNALPNSVCALTPNDEPIVLNQFVPEGGMQKGFSTVGKTSDGVWDFPKPIGVDQYHNSGADVNLTISDDGKVMIMSIERKDSYGKADLYISHKKDNNTWSYPVNLGRGVNSVYRESAPHLSKDQKTLYFSSDRSYPGRGADIYMQERLSEDWNRWSSPRKFRSPINSDADDSHPYFNETTGYLYFSSDREGTFDIYRIRIKDPELNKSEKYIDSIHVDAKSPLTVGSNIEFSNIQFVQSKAEILQSSFKALDQLASMLNNNPNIDIRIHGHTDNVGAPDLLWELSEKRAAAIKDFLVHKKNISSDRIDTKGWGDSKPLNKNYNEKQRRINRRVEIEIISNN